MKSRNTAPLLALACLAFFFVGCSSSGVRIADDWDPVESIIDSFGNDSMFESHEKERYRRDMTEQVRADWLMIHPDGNLGNQ